MLKYSIERILIRIFSYRFLDFKKLNYDAPKIIQILPKIYNS